MLKANAERSTPNSECFREQASNAGSVAALYERRTIWLEK